MDNMTTLFQVLGNTGPVNIVKFDFFLSDYKRLLFPHVGMVLEGVSGLVSPACLLLTVSAEVEYHLFKVFSFFDRSPDIEVYIGLIQVIRDRENVSIIRLSAFAEEVVCVLYFSIESIVKSVASWSQP